jgi:predicted AAA+ superfamily ATPase
MLKDELTSRGIPEDQILYINFESMNYTDIDTASSLYHYVKRQIQEKKILYPVG